MEGLPWLRVDSERDAMIMRDDKEFRRIDSRCSRKCDCARMPTINRPALSNQPQGP